MNISLIYHRNPYGPNPRGGEKSVRAICEFLYQKGHKVALADGPSRGMIEVSDIVLTWGKPASETARVCEELGKPLVLMVRFWKNVAPLPAQNLMTRPVDTAFAKTKEHLFDYASAIVTNTTYAERVITRWQPKSRGKVHVSYVPIQGAYNDIAKPDGKITVITPEIYGESWLIENLSKQLPDERFLVVNASHLRFGSLKGLHNVSVKGYVPEQEVWEQTKILLVPVYDNDICGTRRVTIEAFRSNIPVIASDACGMNEKVPEAMLVSRTAKIQAWVDRIKEMNDNYEWYQKLARIAWAKYDSNKDLEGFEKILKECAK